MVHYYRFNWYCGISGLSNEKVGTARLVHVLACRCPRFYSSLKHSARPARRLQRQSCLRRRYWIMPVSFRVEEDSPSSSSEGDENPDESFTEAEEAAMRSLTRQRSFQRRSVVLRRGPVAASPIVTASEAPFERAEAISERHGSTEDTRRIASAPPPPAERELRRKQRRKSSSDPRPWLAWARSASTARR